MRTQPTQPFGPAQHPIPLLLPSSPKPSAATSRNFIWHRRAARPALPSYVGYSSRHLILPHPRNGALSHHFPSPETADVLKIHHRRHYHLADHLPSLPPPPRAYKRQACLSLTPPLSSPPPTPLFPAQSASSSSSAATNCSSPSRSLL
jgi:hypothetical protein